jgi:hypothetical protein
MFFSLLILYYAIGTIILWTLKATAHDPTITANLSENSLTSSTLILSAESLWILIKPLLIQYIVKMIIPMNEYSPNFIMTLRLFRLTRMMNNNHIITLVH